MVDAARGTRLERLTGASRCSQPVRLASFAALALDSVRGPIPETMGSKARPPGP